MRVGASFRVLACVSATAFALTGCGGNTTTGTALAPADKQIYRANDVTEPNSYDPSQETYTYEAAVGRNAFEPLLKPKADLSDVLPAAAQSYSVSSDGLTYTFHLQPGAKWSDGQAVTAADWVYGWQRLLNPALAAGYVDPFYDNTVAGGQNYGSVDLTSASAIDAYLQNLGLSAPDTHTFVVKLQHPAPYFKWVATLWVGAPIRRDVVEKAAGGSFASSDATKAEMWANNVSTIVGNGAFKISEIVAKDHVTLVPNSNYWGGAPKIQQLILEFIADGNTAFSKYQTGALDQINVPQADVTYVRGDPVLSKQAYLWPELSVFWMTYNWKVSPLDNRNVRLALAKSIDREKLANDVLHGTEKATLSYIPKGMTGYDESDQTQSFDAAAAKADLAASGVSAADLGKLKLLTRNTTGSKLVNQFISDQWNTNLGVNIQLDVIDSKTVTTKIRKGQFDIYGPDGWGADYPDQQDWFDVYTSAACHSLNWGCPVLPGYDELVQKADTELDQTQRNKDYSAARKILTDSAAIGILYQQYEYDLVKPYIGNLQVTPFDDEWLPGDQNYQTAYIKQH